MDRDAGVKFSPSYTHPGDCFDNQSLDLMQIKI